MCVADVSQPDGDSVLIIVQLCIILRLTFVAIMKRLKGMTCKNTPLSLLSDHPRTDLLECNFLVASIELQCYSSLNSCDITNEKSCRLSNL